jgi:GNAT superfamily N-acetyltransferase
MPTSDAPSLAVPLDGMAELPPGTIAAIITFLEMREPPAKPAATAGELSFARLGGGEVDRFRHLFRAVGEPWLWTSRLGHTDAEVSARLADPAIETLAIRLDRADVGMVELDHGVEGAVEIVLFGFVADMVGRGLGGKAMAAVLERVWSEPRVGRVWLHTCTLDHPRALGFYRSFGFRPYLRAIEIAADPRVTGLMPRAAAPDHPVLD